MEIELLRDLVIVVSGLVVILVGILTAVIGYSVYRRVREILESGKVSAARIEALTSVATDEIGHPLAQAARVVQGIAAGVRGISRMFNKGG